MNEFKTWWIRDQRARTPKLEAANRSEAETAVEAVVWA